MAEPLPRSVQEVAEIIGRQKALELVGKLPRLRPPSCTPGEHRLCLYVPEKLHDNHKLVELIGREGAEQLVDRFGGEILHLASCRGIYLRFRNDSIRRMVLIDKIPRQMVAEWMGLSISAVSVICSKAKARP